MLVCDIHEWKRACTDLVKGALKSPLSLGAIIPFLIDNSKCNILIWRSGHKPNQTGIFLTSRRVRLASFPPMLPLDSVRRRLGFINEVGIEYIKLIALDNLGRGVIVIIMSLVVLVPLIPHLYTVEVPGFARSVLVSPLRMVVCAHGLLPGENFFVLANSLCEFPFIQGFGGL